MQKICVPLILVALVANINAQAQTKWSRPIRNTHGQLIRDRRQFPFGEWIPLSKPCPTCRPLVDPLDVAQRNDDIGLTPPRPPTVTRQIHGEGNFFAQDDSSILSVPPPPPGNIPRHHITNSNGNFQNLQFPNFAQHFNNPLPVPSQQIFPQPQPIQFLSQPFLSNQNLLVSSNQPILPVLNNPNTFLSHENSGRQITNNEKIPNFNSAFNQQKFTENVVLEQNARPAGSTNPGTSFSNKPAQFSSHQPQQQNKQQSFNQQPSFIQQPTFTQQQSIQPLHQTVQQQHSGNFGTSILTPPPVQNKNVSHDVVVPGLDKEEIQLLYVPVETLRQRGSFQQQLLTQQPQSIQFQNRPNTSTRPTSTLRPIETKPTTTQQPKGHFVTQPHNNQALNNLKVSSGHPFSTSPTPSTIFVQNLPLHQSPPPFVSATPGTPSTTMFVTPSPFTQKFSPFTPDTTLSHLSTVSNAIQYNQPDIQFVTTPKSVITEEVLREEIITGKPTFDNFPNQKFQQSQVFFNQQQSLSTPQQKAPVFSQQQQSFVNHQHAKQQVDGAISSNRNAGFFQEQSTQPQNKHLQEQRQHQKEKELREQYALKEKQQKNIEEQRFLEQQRQKELEEQRLYQKQQKQKELEEQRYLEERRRKEHEEQILLQQKRQKELEEQRQLQIQRQKEIEEENLLQQQRQRELEEQRKLQKQKEVEEKHRQQQIQREQEEKRLLQWQQQQKKLEDQRILQKQLEDQQRAAQQKFQRQKQESFKTQQQYQQEVLQQKLPQVSEQSSQQQYSGHILPDGDSANLISQVEKETDSEVSQLVPHQPPLSVFYKGAAKGERRILGVLRELRSSRTITVLDQYFEKMPKVFVGPAGLLPPSGYNKFELPYLSNIESNLIEQKADKLPFFVAPLNFVPPPGYSKIPFPSPHVGSVVVSNESASSERLKSIETEENKSFEDSASLPVVGPELPGLINSLETETTTPKSTTPSLPQTTAQLRNRRPNNSLYRPRKPISKGRSQATTTTTTTSRPDEGTSKDESDGLFRKPFNRFLKRRRQQVKPTTESSIKQQFDGKTTENQQYSQQKQTDDESEKNIDLDQKSNRQYGSKTIDRTSASQSTSSFHKSQITNNKHRGFENSGNNHNGNLFEDGPLPTGSAKTITQELYRPNSLTGLSNQELTASGSPTKLQSKADALQKSDKFLDESDATKYTEESKVRPTVGYPDVADDTLKIQTTPYSEYTPVPTSLKYYDPTGYTETENTYTPGVTQSSNEQQTTEFNLDDHYTSAFAEISKFHHVPRTQEYTNKYNSKYYGSNSTPNIAQNLEAPFLEQQNSQDLSKLRDVSPTPSINYSTVPANEEYLTTYGEREKNFEKDNTGEVRPTASGSADSKYVTEYSSNAKTTNFNTQQSPEFIALDNVHGTPYPTTITPGSDDISSQEHFTGTEQNKINENTKAPEEIIFTIAPDALKEINEHFSPENSGPNINKYDGSEDQYQSADGNLSNSQRLKTTQLSNPSIVRVRTRVRGKQRGQINYASSQTTTSSPSVRIKSENKYENGDQDYQFGKTSKYSHFRGGKKAVRPTTETTVDQDQKVNGFTIRPNRRTTSSSTVSTKRIRKPTSPLPTTETFAEGFDISTTRTYGPGVEFPPSGVSNDVYYEQTSFSPKRQKFQKPFGGDGEKSDISTFQPTSTPLSVQTYASFVDTDPSVTNDEDYNKEDDAVKVLSEESTRQETSEIYPNWNPSESGLDVSGIALTTVRATAPAKNTDSEEQKKFQETKKAFDPDLEKKSGRRRVRVRVHKRPHENFETAESQNLRTVANVLVPPTSTYKPNDEATFHLAKNSDLPFAGPKFVGLRSREYFKKRLNLTLPESNVTLQLYDQSTEFTVKNNKDGSYSSGQRDYFEQSYGKDVDYKEGSTSQAESGKFARPKFRGFVRKVIKHTGGQKGDRTVENEEADVKQVNPELNIRQQIKGFNRNGRFNGTRHKTYVRYVKKNKINLQEGELPETEQGKEEPDTTTTEQSTSSILQQLEYLEKALELASEVTTKANSDQLKESEEPIIQQTEEPEFSQKQTEKEEILGESTEPTLVQSHFDSDFIKGTTKLYPVSQQTFKESEEINHSKATEIPLLQTTESRTPYKSRFYHTSRPLYQRTQPSGFVRAKDAPTSTTEVYNSEQNEKRNRPFKYKFGKTGSFISGGDDKNDSKRGNNEQADQQLKMKNLYNSESRKYSRNKSRENSYNQFSRSRYSTEKSETQQTTKNDKVEDEEFKETTTPSERTTFYESDSDSTKNDYLSTENEFKTTQNIAAATEAVDTTKYDESDLFTFATDSTLLTEAKHGKKEIEENTTAVKYESSTVGDTESPTTVLKISSAEPPSTLMRTTTEGSTITATETQEFQTQPDLYRFGKNSFSFDETEKFTGTKNRAYVRNITADVIENTASFSAPGIEKQNEIHLPPIVGNDNHQTTTGIDAEVTAKEKTEVATDEPLTVELSTERLIIESSPETENVSNVKTSKLVKTSTTTKISHETEICYRGKCIRTKSENPEDDLKLLVESATSTTENSTT